MRVPVAEASLAMLIDDKVYMHTKYINKNEILQKRSNNTNVILNGTSSSWYSRMMDTNKIHC